MKISRLTYRNNREQNILPGKTFLYSCRGSTLPAGDSAVLPGSLLSCRGLTHPAVLFAAQPLKIASQLSWTAISTRWEGLTCNRTVKSTRWEASPFGRTRKLATGSHFPAAGNQNFRQGAILTSRTRLLFTGNRKQKPLKVAPGAEYKRIIRL